MKNIKVILIKNKKDFFLKVKLYHFSKKTSKAAYTEYYQFLKDLFDQVKFVNKTLAIRLGLDLFSAYFEGKSYSETIPLLIEMKKLLKKELLKGSTIKDGIDYYLAISSRLGYMGILLDREIVVCDKCHAMNFEEKLIAFLSLLNKDTIYFEL